MANVQINILVRLNLKKINKYYKNQIRTRFFLFLILKKQNMKYLSPEIAALSKKFDVSKSLAKRSVSCGIFQDCDNTKKSLKIYQKEKLQD